MVQLGSYDKGVMELIRDTMRNDTTLMTTIGLSGTTQAANYVFADTPADQKSEWNNPRIVVQTVLSTPGRLGENPQGIVQRENEFQISFWINKKNSTGWSLPFNIRERMVQLFDQKTFDYDFGRGVMSAFEVTHSDDPDKENTTLGIVKVKVEATGG